MKSKIEFSIDITLPEWELDRIFNLVKQGYKEGEVIISDTNSDKNGWWKIK